ncbi:hypothetical protein RB195_013354 [Necator americanus]|uniref:Uncharacterized protein n=1 Tax=Necator americanus TaxID=51031 RepID=A0ABR1DV71_NECAM
MPEGDMKALATNIRQHDVELPVAETSIKDRPIINIDNYIIYCGVADGKKVGGCTVEERLQPGGGVQNSIVMMHLCTIACSQRTQALDCKCS